MPRLMRTMARTAVVAGTATAVSNRVSRRQANRWSDQEAQSQQQYYAQPQQIAAAPEDDPMDRLRELADLKAQGILTEEEFAAQKAKILAQT